LQNAPFGPISASGSNFNPQNTQCIPVVKWLKFSPSLNLNKNEHFSKVSKHELRSIVGDDWFLETPEDLATYSYDAVLPAVRPEGVIMSRGYE